MKRLACSLAALAAALPLWAAPAPARANAFCPATVAQVVDLNAFGHAATYGILIDVDRGDTRSIRLRLDSDRTLYALDVNDVPYMTFSGVRLIRYVTLPLGEELTGAWVQATGLAANDRLDCPLTSPWAPGQPTPTGPGEVEAYQRDRDEVVRTFNPANAPLRPMAFGPAAMGAERCTTPDAPARPLAAIRPAFPPQARAVNATGVVELRLDVDDTGTPIGGRVTRSSGFAPLDRAALDTAEHTKFSPATFQCRPLATSVDVTVGFGV